MTEVISLKKWFCRQGKVEAGLAKPVPVASDLTILSKEYLLKLC